MAGKSGAFIYDGVEIAPSERALDPALAKAFWQAAEQLARQAALQQQLGLWGPGK